MDLPTNVTKLHMVGGSLVYGQFNISCLCSYKITVIQRSKLLEVCATNLHHPRTQQ